MSKDKMKKDKRVCVVCERPVREWPMAHRGDETCSINCAKKRAST